MSESKPLSFEAWKRKRDKRVRDERARQRVRENPDAASAAAAEAKAKRRERYYSRPYSVYRVSFADGMVYIGCTCQDIRSRLSGHKYKCTAVGRRLDMGEKFTVDILGEFPRDPDLPVADDPLREVARQFEAECLAAVPVLNLLNHRKPLEDASIQLGVMRPADLSAFVDDPSLLGDVPPPVYPRPIPEAEEWFARQEENEISAAGVDAGAGEIPPDPGEGEVYNV